MIPKEPFATQLVQFALIAHGFPVGNVDGNWGDKTQAAFDAFVVFHRYVQLEPYVEALSDGQKEELAKFLSAWSRNRRRYELVEAKVNVPAPLIAAIHWRESNGDFNAYLHNGDPLGKPTTHEPKGILFEEWEPAAVDALAREHAALAASALTGDESDLEPMCVYAEYFNGLGYAERSLPSPYILAGTTGYKEGKFDEDGHFSPTDVDGQVGVLVLLRHILQTA